MTSQGGTTENYLQEHQTKVVVAAVSQTGPDNENKDAERKSHDAAKQYTLAHYPLSIGLQHTDVELLFLTAAAPLTGIKAAALICGSDGGWEVAVLKRA